MAKMARAGAGARENYQDAESAALRGAHAVARPHGCRRCFLSGKNGEIRGSDLRTSRCRADLFTGRLSSARAVCRSVSVLAWYSGRIASHGEERLSAVDLSLDGGAQCGKGQSGRWIQNG